MDRHKGSLPMKLGAGRGEGNATPLMACPLHPPVHGPSTTSPVLSPLYPPLPVLEVGGLIQPVVLSPTHPLSAPVLQGGGLMQPMGFNAALSKVPEEPLKYGQV